MNALPLAASRSTVKANSINCPKGMPSYDFATGINSDDRHGGFGDKPSLLMLSPTRVLEAHTTRSYTDPRLEYTFGTVVGRSVKWGKSQPLASYKQVSIANSGSTIVSFEQANGSMYYQVGRIDGDTIAWGKPVYWDSGYSPQVAFLSDDKIAEVHHDNCLANSCRLYIIVGRVDGDTIKPLSSDHYDNGVYPIIASDRHGNLIEFHTSEWNRDQRYNLATLNSATNKLEWVNKSWTSIADTGFAIPSLSWDPNGTVVEGYNDGATGGYKPQYFHALTGRPDMKSGKIEWAPWRAQSLNSYNAQDLNFRIPLEQEALGSYDGTAVVEYDERGDLKSATSTLTDRANWECDALQASLRSKSLHEAVVPASRNSGMYGQRIESNPYQENGVYDQLMGGERYIDLRPSLYKDVLYVHAGSAYGAKMDEIIDDVAKFMSGHREVVVLQFSDWQYFKPGDPTYKRLVSDLRTKLGQWIYRESSEQRIADIPIERLLRDHGVVIPVMDVDFAETDGIYTYRDWQQPDPKVGQFNVFNRPKDTSAFDVMFADQLLKFYAYDGKMERDPSVPCDIFLLAWTIDARGLLTKQWRISDLADQELGPKMEDLRPNERKLFPNVLFTDFYGSADATEVAISMNERFGK